MVPEPAPRPSAPASVPPASLAELVVGGAPGPWRALGFAVAHGRTRVGGVTVRLDPAAGRGLVGWRLRGLRDADLDGLPTTLDGGPALDPAPASIHPNRAMAVDHVVVATPDLERTAAALGAAGLRERRRRQAGSPGRPAVQAFYRLGEVVLEVVGSRDAPAGPARFWGVVFTVADLEACADDLGERLGAVRDAVQPGRRIATVRAAAGLGLPVALMTPPPAASPRPGRGRSGG
jgi:hypothetical protein